MEGGRLGKGTRATVKISQNTKKRSPSIVVKERIKSSTFEETRGKRGGRAGGEATLSNIDDRKS